MCARTVLSKLSFLNLAVLAVTPRGWIGRNYGATVRPCLGYYRRRHLEAGVNISNGSKGMPFELWQKRPIPYSSKLLFFILS